MWLSQYSEAEEVGHQGFRHCRRLFNGDEVDLWLLGDVVDSDHVVSVPLSALRKGDQYVDDYLFWAAPRRSTDAWGQEPKATSCH
jgi:hypothetical protein